MKKLIIVLFLSVSSGSAFSYSLSCNQIGNMTSCSDGTSYNQIGNFTYDSDGTSCQTIWNYTYCN